MIMTLMGIAVIGGCLLLLNVCRPKAGTQSALMQVPWIEAAMPLTLTCLFALGVSLIVGGVLGR